MLCRHAEEALAKELRKKVENDCQVEDLEARLQAADAANMLGSPQLLAEARAAVVEMQALQEPMSPMVLSLPSQRACAAAHGAVFAAGAAAAEQARFHAPVVADTPEKKMAEMQTNLDFCHDLVMKNAAAMDIDIERVKAAEKSSRAARKAAAMEQALAAADRVMYDEALFKLQWETEEAEKRSAEAKQRVGVCTQCLRENV